MQRCRIEVCPVWPDEGARLGVEGDGIERRLILQWRKQRPVQDWLEVDPLLGPIGKGHGENVRAGNAETRHAVDGMVH